MNSGLLTYLTRGRAFRTRGTHQRFDRTAFGLVAARVDPKFFPNRKTILRFEGPGGPDGLKFKGPYRADHQWDPINQFGHLPLWIETHYANMVAALKKSDMVEAGFHAGWLAHYLTDSLTPAHHVSHKQLLAEYEAASKLKQKWLKWGRKGLMTSHVAFEIGITSAMFFSKVKVKFDNTLYTRIRRSGIGQVMKEESKLIAERHLYEEYLERGWTNQLVAQVKSLVATRIIQLIAAAWLAAYAEAGQPVRQLQSAGR